MQQLISIIIPVYKVENFLNRCVESARSQTYVNLEIILVDDGSPDKCPDICDKYLELDNRIKVIHKNNGGLSDARNAGVKVAKGDYIFFLDSDDWIHSKTIEIMVNSINKYNAELVVCNYSIEEDFINEENCDINMIHFEELKSNQALMNMYSNDAFITAWGILLKKELAEKIPFPKGKIHEDEFTTYKYYLSSEKILYIDFPFYKYFRRIDSIMGEKFNIRRFDCLEALRERIEYFDRVNELQLLKLTVERYIDLSLWMLNNIENNKNDRKLYNKELNILKIIIKKYSKRIELDFNRFSYLYKKIDPAPIYYFKKLVNNKK